MNNSQIPVKRVVVIDSPDIPVRPETQLYKKPNGSVFLEQGLEPRRIPRLDYYVNS